MAITAHRYRRVEIWDKWQAAGGARQVIVPDVVALSALSNVQSTDRLTLTLPTNSPAAAFINSGSVIRVDQDDTPTYDEWKIVEGPDDDDVTGMRSCVAAPLRSTDMATGDVLRRIDSDGTNVPDFESVGLTPAQHISTWVIPALARAGLSFVTSGVITPVGNLDMTYAWDSPLSALIRLAEATQMELDIRRYDTNLQLHSQDLNIGWSPRGAATVTGNVAIAPNGTMTADRFDSVIANGYIGERIGTGNFNGRTFTVSGYLRATGADHSWRLGLLDTGDIGVGIFADFVATSQWQRFSVTGTVSIATTTLNTYLQENSGVASTVEVWGIQVREATTPGVYTPTFGTPVTVPGYAIDLVPSVGSSSVVADVRLGRNLVNLRRTRVATEQVTRVFPRGMQTNTSYASMSRATWAIVSTAGTDIVLADPAGGAGPIQFDNQLVGTYLREPSGVLRQVTGSAVVGQHVYLATAISGPVAVGDLVQFRADSAGNDLLWLDSPADQTTYGLRSATFDVPDVPATNNLVKNAVMRVWPGSSAAPPSNWTALGAPTIAKQTAGPYTVIGGNSVHVTATTDGQGVISDAVPLVGLSALNPYVSGFARVWGVSGQFRVELVLTIPTGTVVLPALPDVASNTVNGQFSDIGASGINAFVLGATAIQIRVVQHGTAAADFYVDAAQISQSPSQLPFVEGSGGTRLWQAANDRLRQNGAPLVSYEVPIVDLAAVNPGLWATDTQLSVGAQVRVTDSRLGIAISTRLMEMTRDYKTPGNTRIVLSNRPDDITGTLARPARPARLAPISPVIGVVPAPPVLSASFDSTGQLIINSSGDKNTVSQKIAWGTGVTPSSATVRARTAIVQQLVSGLATGNTYLAGTTVFIAAYAYNASAVESLPIAAISVTRQGSGASLPPVATITPNAAETDDTTRSLTFNAVAGSGGGGANLTWAVYVKIGFATEALFVSGNATILPATYVINRHPRSDKNIRFRATDTATGLYDEASVVVPSSRPELNDTGNPYRARQFDDTYYPVVATNNTGLILHGSALDSRSAAINTLHRTSVDTLDNILNGGTSIKVAGVSAGGLIQAASLGAGAVTLTAMSHLRGKWHRGASTSIPNNTDTKAIIDSADIDPSSLYDAAGGGFKIPSGWAAAFYLVRAYVKWDGTAGGTNANGSRQICIMKNGSPIPETAVTGKPLIAFRTAGGGLEQVTSWFGSLAANDPVQVGAFQDSGGALNVAVVYLELIGFTS